LYWVLLGWFAQSYKHFGWLPPSIQFYNFSNKDFFLPFGQAYEKER
jgi:hypothetical protein